MWDAAVNSIRSVSAGESAGKDEACRGGKDPLASGRSSDAPPMVGDGMAGSLRAVIRETRRDRTAFKAQTEWPEEPPGGSQSVRSSDEAGNDRGAKGRRKVDG